MTVQAGGIVKGLLPTPRATPFTCGYSLILILTTLFARTADQQTVDRLLQGSSADVSNLTSEPLFVLFASALWVAGSPWSLYVVGFPFVLAALEHRIGGWRTAAIFTTGHILAALATQLPVAVAVELGRLPESSLTRLDYGISFGLLSCLAAVSGLIPVLWARLAVAAGIGAMLIADVAGTKDPIESWGHLVSFGVGVALWPLAHRWVQHRDQTRAGPDLG